LFGRRVLAPLAALIAVAVTLTTAVAAPAGAVVGWYKLFQNRHSYKCLEMRSSANFAQASQYTCRGELIQLWHYDTDTGLIQNASSGKCLEVLHYSTANFALVGQYECHGGRNQQWSFRSTGLIANLHSNKCLEVLHYSTADFAHIGQYDCHGGQNQKWWWS
jgi:hypothetical protein